MKEENSFGRLFVVLAIGLVGTVALYWLPDSILGYKLKKVDILADIRTKPATISLDSLMKQLEETDTIPEQELLNDSIAFNHTYDSTMLALRDSLYKSVYAVDDADLTGQHIEDFSMGHIGLHRFFSALKSREKLDRPVRVAFLGDSFIEGDIVVSDFRTALQEEFGGNGVGFVPVFSVTDQFRRTINQQAEGWVSYSILTDTTNAYLLSGSFFMPEGMASLCISPIDKFPELDDVSTLKLYYMGKKPGSIAYVTDVHTDTIVQKLPANAKPVSFDIKKDFKKVCLQFTGSEDLHMFGTALEDNEGIVVDNFSLRGNSGLILDRLNKELCRDFAKVRPYDLIVMQYGLNVVSEEVLNYGWYRTRMIGVVKHLQACFPEADILLMGVSDRSYQVGDEFETMPAVLALLHAQRQIAQSTGIAFWNTFGAMGGVNSMSRYVENNWASKDYTHLSFSGGREIAKALFNALMLEKEFYDEAEKTIH